MKAKEVWNEENNVLYGDVYDVYDNRAGFADVDCIRLCVRQLMQCMKRFPDDKQEIFA